MPQIEISQLKGKDQVQKIYTLRYSNINLEENKKVEEDFFR
jgi:hypothetical protein